MYNIYIYNLVFNFDKKHFPTVFNIACVNERLKRFDTAKKW